MSDPNLPVFEHEEFVRIIGTAAWWRDFQVLVRVIAAYAGMVEQMNVHGDERTERQTCTRCGGTRWEGQAPCPWCNPDPPEVGSFRQVTRKDAERAIVHLRANLHGWFDDWMAHLVRGIEVRETRRVQCPFCEGRVRHGWVACPHCGERLAA
jgi:hypothetical protein